MNQRLHDFNKRVHREVFRIEGNFINHPAAAVSSNKAPVTEIAHCVLAALERNQAVGEFAVKKTLVIEIKRLLQLAVRGRFGKRKLLYVRSIF